MECAIHGWYGYRWNISGDETNGMIHGRTLLSMDMPSIHGWWISMSGMQHTHPLTVQPYRAGPKASEKGPEK